MKNNSENRRNNNSGIEEKARSMKTFAAIVKNYVEACIGDGYSILVQDVRKNNGIVRTGICIKDGEMNIAPNIYLDGYFAEYLDGRPMEAICRDVLRIYGQSRVQGDFDVSSVTDFRRVQGRICFKLVNAERNRKLLSDVPYLPFHDLAVVFYILAGGDLKGGVSTITVKKNIQDMWGVNIRMLYTAALQNTQRLFQSSLKSMSEVLEEMDGEELDGGSGVGASFPIPLYVATNSRKFCGAAVLLYPGLLKCFADKEGDFYILPSSIHEVLLLPCSAGFGPEEIRSLVHEVNSSEVQPEDFLSDNIYRYNKTEGRVEIV